MQMSQNMKYLIIYFKFKFSINKTTINNNWIKWNKMKHLIKFIPLFIQQIQIIIPKLHPIWGSNPRMPSLICIEGPYLRLPRNYHLVITYKIPQICIVLLKTSRLILIMYKLMLWRITLSTYNISIKIWKASKTYNNLTNKLYNRLENERDRHFNSNISKTEFKLHSRMQTRENCLIIRQMPRRQTRLEERTMMILC